jgi:nicotinate-nucleotide--dimethylbenzimidazole phosphoribosyltransferase
VTRWGAVDAPDQVEGSAPHIGKLEPALQWLARCQGAWPPRRPATPSRIGVDGGSPGSIDTGAERADAAIDAGADLLVVSGSGDQAPGLLVAAVLLDIEPVRAVGTAGVPDWARLTVAVRDGLRASRAHRADPLGLLDAVGASAVAELAGLLAQAATRRTPVLLDGSALVGGATLVAGRIAPGASAWWLAGQAPPSPAARGAHTEMGLQPLLDLRLGHPSGADLALHVLCAAVDLLGSSGA